MRVMGGATPVAFAHQIMDSKVTEVQHQLLYQWHQCQKVQKVLGIHTMANSPAGNLWAI